MIYNIAMDFVKNLETYELIVFMAAGLAVLFFGYRIKKVAFFIIWFLLGYNLMTFCMPLINNASADIANNNFLQILFPIIAGLILALLGFLIEKVCISGICFMLTILVVVRYFGTDVSVLALGTLAGIIISSIAVLLMKPATIIATAAAGAYALTLSIFSLAPDISFGTYYWPILIGMTGIGSLVQFGTTKKMK